MIIIVGQGNPDCKYAANRHNLGFMVIDQIASDYGFGAWKKKFRSKCSDGSIPSNGLHKRVLLLKPQTFYNDTGHAVGEASQFFKVESDKIIVFHDEIDLAPGRVRVKLGGGHAGNRGIKSQIAHIGENFRRVRLGIGHPGDQSKVLSYVLSNFSNSDQKWVDALKSACSNALPYLLDGNDERFQTEVLRIAPAPKSDATRRVNGKTNSENQPLPDSL